MPVRRIREDDLDALVADLWLPFAEEMAALDEYNELVDGAEALARAHHRERFDDPDVATFVATDDGALAGYAVVAERPSPPVFARGTAANLQHLYVRPDRRGEGLATALMDRAEAWGRERGCERASLSVNVRNETARRVYEARGYRERRLSMDRLLE